MDSPAEDTVRKVFYNVMEVFAFMFAEAANGNVGPQPGPFLAARMGFTGPGKGTVTLVMPAPLARELAGNVLGVEPDASEARPGDALKELLNVVVGNLLSTLADEDSAFDLGIPELIDFEPADWDALAARRGSQVLLVEEQPVLLAVEIALA